MVFETEQARDKAMFKSKIETKLKNIAERLNAGRKIEWENNKQTKYCIFYDFTNDGLCCWGYGHSKGMGQIHCLDENFLEVAKQEIGEEKLIKYFKELI